MKEFRIAAIVIGTLGVAVTSSAQDRGFVRGLGGTTFGGTETSSLVGGSAGVNVTPTVQLVGEIGRIQNALPTELKEELDVFADLISLEVGLPVKIAVTTPAFYAAGGIRSNLHNMGAVRPFVDSSVGVANISFNVKSSVGGFDVSREVSEEADLDSVTKFLLTLGGGITLLADRPVGVDVGYRYHRIFTETAINASAVYAAVRLTLK